MVPTSNSNAHDLTRWAGYSGSEMDTVLLKITINMAMALGRLLQCEINFSAAVHSLTAILFRRRWKWLPEIQRLYRTFVHRMWYVKYLATNARTVLLISQFAMNKINCRKLDLSSRMDEAKALFWCYLVALFTLRYSSPSSCHPHSLRAILIPIGLGLSTVFRIQINIYKNANTLHSIALHELFDFPFLGHPVPAQSILQWHHRLGY